MAAEPDKDSGRGADGSVTDDVTILLSTFNGARFLPDQLRSFTEQTHTRWRLRWRDDGSDDASRDRLEAYAATQPPGRVARLADDGAHRGIAGSFLSLLANHDATGSTDLVAFADQDDVWLPEKLARGVSALTTVRDGVPALYCARQMLVDQSLRTLGPSPMILRQPSFPAALAQNIATGCTVMLNQAAVTLLARLQAPAGAMHDWWAYIVVAASGGQILVDGIPVVLYRQHGRNAVGAPRTRLRRAAVALHRGPAEFMALLRAHVAALLAMGDRLAPPAIDRLRAIDRALRGGALDRLRLLHGADLQRQTWAETLALEVWFLLG